MDAWDSILSVLIYVEMMSIMVCMNMMGSWPAWEGMIKMAFGGVFSALNGTIAWGIARGFEFGVVVQIVCPLVVIVVTFGMFLTYYYCLPKEEDEEKQVSACLLHV